MNRYRKTKRWACWLADARMGTSMFVVELRTSGDGDVGTEFGM